jgi:hypothetical protein
MLKRTNGAVTPFRNAEYLPAYFFIPQSLLAQCGTELNSIPRNPRKLISNWDAIAIVESDLFRLLIIDAYAFMVWPFLCPGVKREIYSGYEPSWIFAHSPAYWVQKLQDEKIIPTAEDLFKDGGVDVDFGYVDEREVEALFCVIVPQVIEKHKMQEVMDIAREYRCFEDFDFRKSRQKTDFYRQWYHTRTKHPTLSLEGFQEDYAAAHDGQEWDFPDESADMTRNIVDKVQVKQFLATLTEKDRQMLTLRMEGLTHQEIAGKLGYRNHSGVLKRIRKIGEQYENFTGTNLGF